MVNFEIYIRHKVVTPHAKLSLDCFGANVPSPGKVEIYKCPKIGKLLYYKLQVKTMYSSRFTDEWPYFFPDNHE